MVVAGVALLILGIGPDIALFAGLVIGWFGWNPNIKSTSTMAHYLLSAVIILMGFGMNIGTVISTGTESLGITLISITGTLALGIWLARRFKIVPRLGLLLACGTSICGGSAIAAIGPAIKAHRQEMAVSMGVVFLLNGVALWVFPWIGHLVGLSQEQFGWWAALAIHDTSSVVGACAQYGQESLHTGTLIKLTRALWIIPLAFIAPKFLPKHPDMAHFDSKKINIPWPLIGFLAASILVTLLPDQPAQFLANCSEFGKPLMTLILFWIGASLSRQKIRQSGIKPILMALILWIIAASATLTWLVI